MVALIPTWGYFFLTLISIFEGPVVAIIAGFLVSIGQMNWFFVFLFLCIGDLLGDVLHYYVGRWGHGPWAERMAARFGVTPERIQKFDAAFLKHDVKVLLINKTQALGSVMLYYAGAVRMSLWRFFWINLLGTVPKVILFEAIGYYFGRSYQQISGYLDYAALATLLVPIGLLLSYWFFRRYSEEQQESNPL